jgi:hypothetical protein
MDEGGVGHFSSRRPVVDSSRSLGYGDRSRKIVLLSLLICQESSRSERRRGASVSTPDRKYISAPK